MRKKHIHTISKHIPIQKETRAPGRFVTVNNHGKISASERRNFPKFSGKQSVKGAQERSDKPRHPGLRGCWALIRMINEGRAGLGAPWALLGQHVVSGHLFIRLWIRSILRGQLPREREDF